MRLNSKVNIIVGLLLVMGMLISVCASAPVENASNTTTQQEGNDSGCAVIMNDSQSTENLSFDNTRDVHYAEVFLICGQAGTNIYNTAGLNNENNSNDTAPESIMANFSTEAVKEQYKVQNVSLNGPRYFLMDSFSLPTGTTVRDLDGLNARWMATLQPNFSPGGQPYISATVERKSTWFFDKGKPVFILEDSNGTAWVMKSYTDVVDKNLTYDGLQTLGTQLKMPPGWKYRVEVLPENLTMVPVNGTARITQDELQNTYDACDNGVCNVKL